MTPRQFVRHLLSTESRPFRAIRQWARKHGPKVEAKRFGAAVRVADARVETLEARAAKAPAGSAKRARALAKAENWKRRRREWREAKKDAEARIAAAPGTPSWLPLKHSSRWARPWEVNPSSGAGFEFKRILWDHGRLSPNFTRREAGGGHRHPLGGPIPDHLRHNAQYHAFVLERVRHDLGDVSMNAGSWYRNPAHNKAVKGATSSQHMQAWGTDWFSEERARHGGDRFDAAMNKHFSNGGRGYQGRIGGPIRHVDNGPARSWVYV